MRDRPEEHPQWAVGEDKEVKMKKKRSGFLICTTGIVLFFQADRSYAYLDPGT